MHDGFPVHEFKNDGYLPEINPSPDFDSRFYMVQYPDVANSGQNPLLHYLLYGRDEGRLTKAGRALTLERKLWEGFSRYCLEEMESIKLDSDSAEQEQILAAWSMMVWYTSQEKYTQALENASFAFRLRESLKGTKKWAIIAAFCHAKLGKFNSARDLLEVTLTRNDFDPDIYLLMANTALLEKAPADFLDIDAFRLHLINRVFNQRGLAPIKKKELARRLALDNIIAKIPPRPTSQGAAKISVIIPAYNAYSTLAYAIESVLSQTWADIELIVVDDCSTDNTFAIAQRYAAQDPRVRALRQPRNMGAYEARNAGARISTGDFITVHDCDDWSHPQKLEMQLVPILDDSQLLGSFSYWTKVDWDMTIVGGWRPWGKLIDFNHSSFLFRRSLLDSIGEWDNVLVTGDTEFIWRAEAKHGKDAFAKVCPDAPLSFSLAASTSLTQASNTHVKTVFYGLRRTYREAARWWHAKEGKNLYLRNDDNKNRRPFPAPDAILSSPMSGPVSHVLVSDFSRTALASEDRPIALLEKISGIRQTALFHWPNYCLDEDSPIDDRIFEITAKNNVRLLVPGETIDAEAAIIIQPEPLRWIPDSLPVFKCRSVIVIDEDSSDGALEDDIRVNIESAFGQSPIRLPLSIVSDYLEVFECDLFSSDWYLDQYQDVAAAGVDPLQHYLSHGAVEGRDPGPVFSTSAYLALNPDVAEAGINPLLHYIRYGKQEGRLISSGVELQILRRSYCHFSEYLTYSMLDPLVKAPFSAVDKSCFAFMEKLTRWLIEKLKSYEQQPVVSIIMPMRDRAPFVGDSIRSVLEQAYSNFELIVIDDGSQDDSVTKVRAFTDSRIRLIENNPSAGVSAARNQGLAEARGELIAYLDSDNTWKPDYLGAMVSFFNIRPDADAAYGGQYLYRGKEIEPFAVRFGCYNPSLLRNRNYIDLNCFVHRRATLETIGGGFSDKITRWVDWEFILRIASAGTIYSVPVLQSNYYLGKTSNTITETIAVEPAREYILDKFRSWTLTSSQDSREPLTRKVAVGVIRSDDLAATNTCLESFCKTSGDPLVQVLATAEFAGTGSELRPCNSTAEEKYLPAENPNPFLDEVAQSLKIADPDCDLLIMDPKARLATGALPAMQRAAYASESIAVVAPQCLLPGGHPDIKVHVPYAFQDVPCDVALSHQLRNVEKVPLFYDGGVVELNYTPFFCVYIKREAWDAFRHISNLQDDAGQHARMFCDFVRHVLDKRIVYTSDAVVLNEINRNE